jgi:hypothetical protein
MGAFWCTRIEILIADGRLRYHAERVEVVLVSDAASGPYVGVRPWPARRTLPEPCSSGTLRPIPVSWTP